MNPILWDQLEEIGVSDNEIELIALSHRHFDHTGAANYFPEARLLIQEEEYKAVFLDEDINPVFDFELYKELEDNPLTILNGDRDVFRDGLVKILAAPGHTPGSQVLFIKLAQYGPTVLSGDL